MAVIEPLFINGKALHNMNDDNTLRHNDGQWHHQIFIFVKVVNDAATWTIPN